jgi:hypothetical protein
LHLRITPCLYVQTVNRGCFNIPYSEVKNRTGRDIKLYVSSKIGVNVCKQGIIFNRKEIPDNVKLIDLGIKERDEVIFIFFFNFIYSFIFFIYQVQLFIKLT